MKTAVHYRRINSTLDADGLFYKGRPGEERLSAGYYVRYEARVGVTRSRGANSPLGHVFQDGPSRRDGGMRCTASIR